MELQTIVLNEKRNVTLTMLLQPSDKEFSANTERPAVVILPGGGYKMCSDREAEPVAFEFLKAGFQAFVLRYSVGAGVKWPEPLEDYEQAVSLIKENAEKWHISKERIAVIGFSAGGHLAACTATIAKNKPNAAILAYPAIIEDTLNICIPNLPRPAENVDGKTCPCFVFGACDDNVAPIENVMAFQNALIEKKIRFESHVYPSGKHGFSIAEDWIAAEDHTSRLKNWITDCISWLGELWGEYKITGFTSPLYSKTVNDDFSERYTVNCSLSCVMNACEGLKEEVGDVFVIIDGLWKSFGFSQKTVDYLSKLFTVKDLLTLKGFTKEQIEEVNKKINKYKNDKI